MNTNLKTQGLNKFLPSKIRLIIDQDQAFNIWRFKFEIRKLINKQTDTPTERLEGVVSILL